MLSPVVLNGERIASIDTLRNVVMRGSNTLMSDLEITKRLTALESEIQELKAVQELLLRLLSTTRPLSGVLEYYGATESTEQALYRYLDEMVERIRGPEHGHPTFSAFQVRIGGLFPQLRGDRQFIQLLIDTLKVERPAYAELYRFMNEHHWPVWD